jgi:hypothetical protein
LQHPGDQRDQHTQRPQRVFKRIHLLVLALCNVLHPHREWKHCAQN